jgi:signal peptidase I
VSARKKKKKTKEATGPVSAFWGLFKTLGIAVGIAIVVRTFLFEPFSIPSASMYPGLLVGDYLFVSKYSYGYSNYSYPLSPDLYKGRILEGQPTRGDVVVFRQPANTSKDFIKRIVGLPGDRIEYRGGILHINGKPVRRRLEKKAWGFVDFVYRDDGSVVKQFGRPAQQLVVGVLYREWLPGETASAGHHILLCGRGVRIPFTLFDEDEDWRNQPENANKPKNQGPLARWVRGQLSLRANRDWQNSCGRQGDPEARNERFPPVRKGHFFMMGDNRDNSTDSRLTLGQVPFANLIGRAEFRFFSSDGTARLWEVWKWPSAIRFNRLFTGIE